MFKSNINSKENITPKKMNTKPKSKNDIKQKKQMSITSFFNTPKPKKIQKEENPPKINENINNNNILKPKKNLEINENVDSPTKKNEEYIIENINKLNIQNEKNNVNNNNKTNDINMDIEEDEDDEEPIFYKKKVGAKRMKIDSPEKTEKKEEINQEMESPRKPLKNLRRGSQLKRRINYKESDSEESENDNDDDDDEYKPKEAELEEDDDDEDLKNEVVEEDSESIDNEEDEEEYEKPIVKSNKKKSVSTREAILNAMKSPTRTPKQRLSEFRSPKSKTLFELDTSDEKKKEKAEKFKEKNDTRYHWLLDIKDAKGNRPTDPDYDPRTLYIPSSAWRLFTPFEQQYWEIKCKHWEKVVFFKKGKFYELYEKDADIGHQEFDLKMTDRVNMRMVGVPEATFEHWASQFIAKGYKVAKVDQMETALKKSMNARNSSKREDKVIKRELSQVLTAGTLVDSGFLTNDMSAYCMCIKEELQQVVSATGSSMVTEERSPPKFGVCFVDTTTATFKLSTFVDDLDRTRFETLLIQYKPKEIVIERGGLSQRTTQMLKRIVGSKNQWNILIPEKEFWSSEKTEMELKIQGYFSDSKSSDMDIDETEEDDLSPKKSNVENWPEALKVALDEPVLLSAVGGLVWYLQSLKIDRELLSLKNFSMYDPVKDTSSLILDGQTLINLEVFQNNSDGSNEGTLFELLEHCTTPFGKRMFRNWICHPLRSVSAIEDRLNASDDMLKIDMEENNLRLVDYLDTILRKLPDLERIISRIHAGSCKVKEFISSLKAFTIIMELFVSALSSHTSDFSSNRLTEIANHGFLDILKTELDWFQNAFIWEKAMNENFITPIQGYDDEYDQCNGNINELEGRLQAYLKEQQKKLGSREIIYRDLGKEIYQIQVPKRLVSRVPKNWIQMSKTQAVNRYYSPELRSLIQELNEARELFNDAQANVKMRIYGRFDEHYAKWLKVIQLVAEVDCLACLARCREILGEPLCRPEFIENTGPQPVVSTLELTELRHPCVNVGITQDFIPNDTFLGGKENDQDRPKLILLTGPNMGGKSTLLRQTCVAVIMAQLGCYVPAVKCRLTPFDRIFTRIGANDNILAGQSTFMIELSETSKILKEATPHSLVILDELGRGTSTYDGFSIAYSVLHHLITRIQCLGLFSTHYGMLTDEYQSNPLVACKYMSFQSDEEKREVTFLYKLTDGVCPKSYGMNVASIAGVPESIVLQAERIASEFEKTSKLRDMKLTTTDKLTMLKHADFSFLYNIQKAINSNNTLTSEASNTIKAIYHSLN